MQEANLRWFVTDTHGILHAQPRPRYATFAPIFTPEGRRGVWPRPRFRPPGLEPPGRLPRRPALPRLLPRHRLRPRSRLRQAVSAGARPARLYRPQVPPHHRQHARTRSPTIAPAALRAADEHAAHFLEARLAQFRRLAEVLDRPPIVVAPYDAELFGHWWYEGPEFIDFLVRKACRDQKLFELITPGEFLGRHPTHQVAMPAASSWGEGGYWKVWLNEKNEWIYPHLRIAQERMTELARRFPQPDTLQERMLKQAARELLLAQASDWPFILQSGTSPGYARKRVKEHLLRFTRAYEQLVSGQLEPEWLQQVESQDNLFPELNHRYWA